MTERVLKADSLPPDQYAINMDLSEVGNPRLKMNMPIDKALIEITDTKPPLLVVVCRADIEVQAFGMLEKAKFMVLSAMKKLNSQAGLTAGVREMAKLLGGK